VAAVPGLKRTDQDRPANPSRRGADDLLALIFTIVVFAARRRMDRSAAPLVSFFGAMNDMSIVIGG
jgi:hypothetical protein